MKRLTLSAVLSDNSRTAPLFDGSVGPEGIDLVPSSVHPSEMFWRQLHFGDFDVSEMSLSSLFVMVDRFGRDALNWVALPVFTSRRYFHTGALVRADSGIESPVDLKGRRVGVPEYQQTAAVWSRGVLQDHFDVAPSDIRWFMERTPDMDHASGTGFTPPEGVELTRIPRDETLATYLLDGRIDASLMYLKATNLVDRSQGDLAEDDRVRPLFDVDAESRRYHEVDGLYPINHAVVLRRSLVEEHPWVVLNVYAAFGRANDLAFERVRALRAEYLMPGVADDLDANPYRYGLAANAPELATLSRYAHEQGLTSKPLRPEDVFDVRTHSL